MMDRVRTSSIETLCIVAMAEVEHRLPYNASDNLKQFCASLPVFSIRFLADGLKKECVRLYEECATVADKYLKFNLNGTNTAVIILLTTTGNCGLHPDDPIAVDVEVWSQWHCVAMKYSLTKDDANNFLILFVVVFMVSCCVLVIMVSCCVLVIMVSCCVLVIQPLMLVSLLHSHGLKTVMMCIIVLEELLYLVCCRADIPKSSLVHYHEKKEYQWSSVFYRNLVFATKKRKPTYQAT